MPAKLCKFSLVDRIFTRIGASDKLIEGKSTFFIEMEETSNVVKYGTSNSLVIMVINIVFLKKYEKNLFAIIIFFIQKKYININLKYYKLQKKG